MSSEGGALFSCVEARFGMENIIESARTLVLILTARVLKKQKGNKVAFEAKDGGLAYDPARRKPAALFCRHGKAGHAMPKKRTFDQ